MIGHCLFCSLAMIRLGPTSLLTSALNRRRHPSDLLAFEFAVECCAFASGACCTTSTNESAHSSHGYSRGQLIAESRYFAAKFAAQSAAIIAVSDRLDRLKRSQTDRGCRSAVFKVCPSPALHCRSRQW